MKCAGMRVAFDLNVLWCVAIESSFHLLSYLHGRLEIQDLSEACRNNITNKA
jgi:hypothetical protein